MNPIVYSLSTSIAAAAHAAAEYHRELGAPVDELRASMAVSTRTEASGSNAFTLVRLLVPTTEMPIADRFRAVAAATTAAQTGAPAAGLDSLAALAAPLPARVVTRLVRQQAQTLDFATSNVKGSPVPAYVSGAEVLEVYPIGPLGGVAFNLTLMSYHGSLDMGLHVDRVAVEHPDLLRGHLDAAFDELVAS